MTIVANLSGLAPGEYGWHIHQFGDESSGRSTNSNNGDIDPTIVGTHFDNGAHPLHGCWPSGDRHTGDLGNLTITEFDRINTFTIVRDLIDLSPTSNSSIIGRMLIIHRNYDVCIQPTGGAGVMLAQGVIGIGDPAQYGSEANNTAGIQLPWTDESPSESVVAVGVFHPTTIGASGSSVVSGTVYLSQLTHVAGLTDQLRVMVNLSGLEPWSSHGLHIHEWGDDSTGGHFNPYGRTHGLPSMDADYRHAGDLGNVLADANGYAMSDFVVDAVSLVGLPNVLGRSLVLQSAPDTGEADSYAAVGFTRSTNAIAQAVIGLTTYRPPARLSSGWFARATIRGSTAYPLVSATVTFSQPQGPGLYSPTTITGTFFNLPLGKDGASTSYALHIHEFGDLTSDPIDLTVVGGHFNPLNKPHGCPPNIDRHAGDIGNVAVTSTATFTATFINPLIDLADSIKSVIGRSLVLHNGTDRCVQPAGNSGTPIASGVIGIVAPPIAGYINKANNIFINQTASLIARLYPTKDGPGIGGTIQMAMDQTKRFRVIVTINGSKKKQI